KEASENPAAANSLPRESPDLGGPSATRLPGEWNSERGRCGGSMRAGRAGGGSRAPTPRVHPRAPPARHRRAEAPQPGPAEPHALTRPQPIAQSALRAGAAPLGGKKDAAARVGWLRARVGAHGSSRAGWPRSRGGRRGLRDSRGEGRAGGGGGCWGSPQRRPRLFLFLFRRQGACRAPHERRCLTCRPLWTGAAAAEPRVSASREGRVGVLGAATWAPRASAAGVGG
ncbi:hypothetical protein P7K49_028375, partial [Saguinus oedipus]